MTGEISRRADGGRLARCAASVMAALVVCGSALANDADAIRKRLRYVGTLNDVAWFEVPLFSIVRSVTSPVFSRRRGPIPPPPPFSKSDRWFDTV